MCRGWKKKVQNTVLDSSLKKVIKRNWKVRSTLIVYYESPLRLRNVGESARHGKACWLPASAASWPWASTPKGHRAKNATQLLVPWCRRWRLWWGRRCSSQRGRPHPFAWCRQQCPGEHSPLPGWRCRSLDRKNTNKLQQITKFSSFIHIIIYIFHHFHTD